MFEIMGKNMNIINSKALALRKKVRSAHRKIKFVGTLYLLGTIALLGLTALVAVMQIIGVDGQLVSVDVLRVWELLKWQKPLQVLPLKAFIVACLYVLLLATLLCNVIRCLSKMRGLYCEKVTRENGFNENFVYLQTIGKIFSGSLAMLCNVYLLAFLLAGKDGFEWQFSGLITLGVGLVFHFLCGLTGGKVRLFSYDVSKADYVEHKREIGRVAPFFRNLLQLCIMAGVSVLLWKINVFPVVFSEIVINGFDGVLADKDLLIECGLQLLMTLFVFALIAHATSDREFDRDGKEAQGAKRFRGYSLLLFLVAIGYTVWTFIADGKVLLPTLLAVLALAGLLVDCFVEIKATSDEDALTGKKKKVRTGVIFDTVSYEGRI